MKEIPHHPHIYAKYESIIFTHGEDIYLLWCPGYRLPGYAQLHDYNTFGQDPNLVAWYAARDAKIVIPTDKDVNFEAPYSKIFHFKGDSTFFINSQITSGMKLRY